ncbi:MAG: tyrosine-type recombinase/integrase [Methylobacter sp.]
MAITINFTQDRIRSLPSPINKGREDYYDSGCPKLICRVSGTGNKSFVVMKKTADGKTRRITLGRFPDLSVSDARKMAQAALTDLAQGVNPTAEKRKQRLRSITLQELLNMYLKDKSDLREASVFDYTKKINQGFSDWLNKPINEITRDMVLARRKQLEGGRDNKLRVLRLLMRYAVVTLKALDENPVDVLRDGSLWSKPKRKKRIIPSDNLKDWYNAVLNLENEKAKVYLLLLLHTGLRDQDVRYLEWKDVDFKNDCFIVRDTKNHTDFTAYLAPQVKPFLRSLHALTGDNLFVFPGESKDGVMNIPRKPIAQVCNQTGIEFSSHDLKRTFLTIGEAAMIPFSLLKALANHKTDNDVTGGYINPETKTLKAATFKIADYIQQHTAPDNQNIVTLRTATH